MSEIINSGGGMDNIKPIDLQGLIDAAKSEEWDMVDDNLGKMADNPEVISWATDEGLKNEDENIRDLAVSVLESSSKEIPEDAQDDLREKITNDTGIYVRFRSAFALFRNGDRSEEVIAKIREALEDEDVKEETNE